MASAFFVKNIRSLYPTDEAGEDIMKSLGQGEVIEVTIRKPRNPRFHRLFWGLMTLVWQNINHDTLPTVETLVTEMKIRTGHYERRDIEVAGKTYPVLTPKSIGFAAMDDTQFKAFFEKCCDIIAADYLPGITAAQWREEIEQLIGVRA